MDDWTNVSEEEVRRRVRAWFAAEGHAPKYRKLLEQGPEASRLAAPDGAVAALVARSAARLLTPAEECFPQALAERLSVVGPLLVRGDLPEGRTIAVVGSRACSHEGERLTKSVVRKVAQAGVAVISGGALGVDTIAHRAALAVGAPTVAFLPCGFRNLTPRRNERLFEQIASNGAVVTEYPPDVSARKYHFHRRNRLIAAFADAVLVVRAKERSGTMITARAALELGRPVLAIPGSPEDATAGGCNGLIRSGAACVRDGDDVLEELGLSGVERAQRPLPLLSEDAQAIVEAVEQGDGGIDDIVRRTQFDVAHARVVLLELEMSGVLRKLPGGERYRGAGGP